MVKAELGTKRICPSCGTKFYDLLKSPIVCPKCGVSFIAATLLPSKGDSPQAPVAKPVREPPPQPAARPAAMSARTIVRILSLFMLSLRLSVMCRIRKLHFGSGRLALQL